MDFRLRMAFTACTGSAFINLVFVTCLALEADVGAIQFKEIGVVEMTQAVYTIVAVQASAAKLFLVALHKFRFTLRMAVDTGVYSYLFNRVPMAGCAIHPLALETFRMQRQAESGVRQMIERFAFPGSRLPACRGVAGRTIASEKAFMSRRVGMTSLAIARRIF
jgi:hypothetical protein